MPGEGVAKYSIVLNTTLYTKNWAAPNASGAPFENHYPWTSNPLHCLIVHIHTLVHNQEIRLQPFRSSMDILKYLITQGLSNWLQTSLEWTWNWRPSVWAYVFPLMSHIVAQLESIFSSSNLFFSICHLVMLKLPNGYENSTRKWTWKCLETILSYAAV